MKKIWKRTAKNGMALLLTVSLILSAAACGASGSGSSSAGGLVGDIDIYDPEAGEITEQYEVEGANLTYCRTVDDETICAVGDDSTYYLVSREDGSCTAYSYN